MEQNKFYQIKNITEHEYTLVGCDGSVITRPIQDVDRLASAFTIEDAKDGDVLVSESNCGLNTWYCIFKSLDGDESMTVHCYLSRDGRFETKKELCFDKDPYSTKPATKEQRDLLFQKMKEAGYEWDAEKKELKKIEKNPAWSEEDEEMFKTIANSLDRGLVERVWHTTIKEVIAWLKSLKDRVQPQPKQEWSEEDNEHIKSIISTIECSKAQFPNSPAVLEAYNSDLIWLKSLRPHSKWKPSERQLDVLKSAISELDAYDDSLTELYNDLKKLKD